jgi:soluble lytic murein transglycosylase-like protein
MINRYSTLVVLLTASFPAVASDQHSREMLEALAAQHAKAHGVPVGLVHRVIMRESRYNPRAISRGNYGLMQIRHATARGMGYNGPASGLLDPHINLTYAVPYLANAYRVAGRNQDRAVALYTSGYYYDAKRKGLLSALTRGEVVQPQADPAPAPANALEATLSSIFGLQAQSVQALEVASTDASPAPSEKRRYRRAAQKRAKGTVSASSADSATTIRAAGNVSTHTKRPVSTIPKP